jgi:PAP2 superfamily protein
VTAARIRVPLGRAAGRHSLLVEATGVLVLYALYEAARGLIAGDRAAAVRHAHDVASLERSLHVFVESHVQDGAQALPGVIGTLGLLYLTLHLAVTGVYLLWLYRRRPDAFPIVRTTLLFASALALVGYVLFPTAPPREAALGIADTISGGRVDLDHGLVSSLYNPFAAVPSMHVGYAFVVGVSLVVYGRRSWLRALGVAYPALVVLVVVATGNHFFFDAAAGIAVAVVGAALAYLVLRPDVRVQTKDVVGVPGALHRDEPVVLRVAVDGASDVVADLHDVVDVAPGRRERLEVGERCASPRAAGVVQRVVGPEDLGRDPETGVAPGERGRVLGHGGDRSPHRPGGELGLRAGGNLRHVRREAVDDVVGEVEQEGALHVEAVPPAHRVVVHRLRPQVRLRLDRAAARRKCA